MIMIQDDPMPTGADKPLRITGDPHKVQVRPSETQTWSDAAALSLTFTPPKNFFFIIVSNLHLIIIQNLIFLFCFIFLQQARELVVKLIREKDQGDFRSGRADFGPKMGGSSLDVRPEISAFFFFFSQTLSTYRIYNLILFYVLVFVFRWLCPGLLSASSLAEMEK